MSYILLSEETRFARKEHQCIWCPEKIKVGEKYVREASTNYGDFQDHKWHPECRDAANRYFTEDPGGDGEFMPQEYKRGTTEMREYS